MDEEPIETTVTLRWDILNNCWRDKETGVKVTGVHRWISPARRAFAEREGIPLDRWGPAATVPSHDDTRHIRELVLAVLVDRIVFHDHYFVNDPAKLASYGYVRQVAGLLSSEINRLEFRVVRLELPFWKRWWRRWFH